MTAIHVVVDVLGFDPTLLSGRPTGYAMLYWGGLSVALSLSMVIVLSASLDWAGRLRWFCIGGALIGLFFLTVLQHALFVEYPGYEIVAPDTGIKEPYIVPIPMPGLRSEDFDLNWGVGSPNYRNASPDAYAEEGLKEDNFTATLATILLHWIALMLFLICLFSASLLAMKALLASILRSWGRR